MVQVVLVRSPSSVRSSIGTRSAAGGSNHHHHHHHNIIIIVVATIVAVLAFLATSALPVVSSFGRRSLAGTTSSRSPAVAQRRLYHIFGNGCTKKSSWSKGEEGAAHPHQFRSSSALFLGSRRGGDISGGGDDDAGAKHIPSSALLVGLTAGVARSSSSSLSTSLNGSSSSSSMSSSTTTTADNNTPPPPSPEEEEEDPYLWLEEVESSSSLEYAKAMNDECLSSLGDPKAKKDCSNRTYERVLAVLESDDRIPHVSKFGVNEEDGEQVLYNFWKDGKNPKGLWRKTTLTSYKKPLPEWTTVLDLDALGTTDDVSWVWKGSRPLPRSRDPPHKGAGAKLCTRALVLLSRGGADAVVVREMDLEKMEFVEVEDGGFYLPEAKTRVSYKSRDVLTVGSDFGPGTLTDSGYPRTVKEWVRGTSIEDAPTIFEGEKTDVSVGCYIDDQRKRVGGGIYEVQSRSLTFYTSKEWVRQILPEHLLAPDDPDRADAPPPPDFIQVDVQDDAEIDFFAHYLLVSLRSDWTVGDKNYPTGSLIASDYDDFITNGKDGCTWLVLFEPTDRTALETYTATKQYLILSIMEDVKSRMVFYKLVVPTAGEEGGDKKSKLVKIGGDGQAQIRATHAGAYDPTDSDEFWFTTSSYLQPSTLSLADANLVVPASSDDGDEIENTKNDGGGGDDAYVVEKLKSLPPQYDASGLVVEQRFATSKDGTEIPYFLVRKADTPMDGTTPTLLYGYGGFEISLGPHYVASPGIAWLERGGAYVEANIRGGGEYGPSWHQAGLKENRNKCYEDFIAVGEDLISSGLCKSSTLGIRGGSNGGLLMGNMLVMRPDLFGAIHCAVPLLDMKRFHLLLAGASWMAEYGDPSTDDWDKFLHKYSPYHNINPDETYPPILFTTSTRDDRVHPAHARKMVKKLIDVGKGNWPVYYYENIEGGHGGAADSKQSAFMTSLAYDFLWDTLSGKRADAAAAAN